MLGDVRARLEANLRARPVPVRVEYGPVDSARVGELRDVVVVEYDRGSSDAISAPRARGGNPRRRFERAVACKATIYVTNTVAGARRQDHEDRAQKVIDQVLVALDDVLRGGQLDASGVQIPGTSQAWAAGPGSFVDLPGTAVGAAYEVAFVIHRGVFDERGTFGAGSGSGAAPEFVLSAGSIESRTDVFGSTGEGAGETSCGG